MPRQRWSRKNVPPLYRHLPLETLGQTKAARLMHRLHVLTGASAETITRKASAMARATEMPFLQVLERWVEAAQTDPEFTLEDK